MTHFENLVNCLEADRYLSKFQRLVTRKLFSSESRKLARNYIPEMEVMWSFV